MTEVFDFDLFPRLETERLSLREIVPADADDVFAFRSDPIAQKHNDPPHQNIAETRDMITWIADEYRQKLSLRWGVCLKEDERVIGLIGYNYWDRANRRSGLGYDLAREHWGKGLVPEALRAITSFGFERMNLNKIEAHTNSENTQSVRMIEKLGFWLEGVFHNHFYEDDTFHDVSLFALLRRDFVPAGE